MKNKTQGEMVNARQQALLHMKLQRIVLLHHILDIKTSQEYKDDIRETGMTYQIVPPDNRRLNISKRAIQTWKNNFSAFSAEWQQHSRYTCGTKKSHRPIGSSSSLGIPMTTHRYFPTPMCTSSTTIAQRHLCPSSWRPYSMTSPIGENIFLNTAGKAVKRIIFPLIYHHVMIVGGKIIALKNMIHEPDGPRV